MKVQITLADELVARADQFADENYMTRSGLINVALTQYLNSNALMLAVRDLSLAVRKVADTGEIDKATQEQLEDFERLAKMLVGKK